MGKEAYVTKLHHKGWDNEKDNTYDCIVLDHALNDYYKGEHPELCTVLKEINRVLKPNGRLIILDHLTKYSSDPVWDYRACAPLSLNIKHHNYKDLNGSGDYDHLTVLFDKGRVSVNYVHTLTQHLCNMCPEESQVHGDPACMECLIEHAMMAINHCTDLPNTKDPKQWLTPYDVCDPHNEEDVQCNGVCGSCTVNAIMETKKYKGVI